MPKTLRRGGGENVVNIEQPKELSDVDRLLAEAMQAAEASQRSADAGEIASAKGSKKQSAEMAERTERLQQEIAGYSATDVGVEDYHYESILRYVESEMGVATSEKVTSTLAELRKAGAGLRKFADIETKSPALLVKLDELHALHAKLFEEVQTAVVNTLEQLKKKFKGEASSFEARYGLLTDSPLVRGIVYDEDSPERRVEGLRQEVVELFMRPLVEGRLKVFERKMVELPTELQRLTTAWTVFTQQYPDRSYEHIPGYDNTPYHVDNFKNQHGLPKTTRNGLDNEVGNAQRKLASSIEDLSKRIPREKLALEVNRTVLEKVLGEAKNETELAEAVQELETYIKAIRAFPAYQFVSWHDTGEYDYIKLPKSPLAKKILGYYEFFAVDAPGNYEGDVLTKQLSPSEQLIARSQNAYEPRSDRGIPISAFLSQHGKVAFLESVGSSKNEQDMRWQAENGVDDRNLIVPTHSGSGTFWNLARAFKQVDGGYTGQKDELKNMPKELEAIGWTMSKLGAFVEPGQDARVVDRKYSQTLLQLANPQIKAERAFDVRSPDGAFHVYTTEQAVDLLRRARRDAQAMIQDMEQAAIGEQDGKQGDVIERMQQQRERSLAIEKELSNKERELTVIREKLREQEALVAEEGAGRRRSDNGWGKAQQEAVRAQERLRDVKDSLNLALAAEKPGIFGGDKTLRAALTAILEGLRKT